jgi:hypothetical protein
MVQILKKIEAGDATQSELDLLLDVCDRILGKCLCPLGDAAAMPIASYVTKFRDEFQAHVDRGGCPLGDSSSLDGLLAPSTSITTARRCVSSPSCDGHHRRPRGLCAKGTGLVGRTWASIGVLLQAASACRSRLPHVSRRAEGAPAAAACTLTGRTDIVKMAQTSAWRPTPRTRRSSSSSSTTCSTAVWHGRVRPDSPSVTAPARYG